MNSKETMFIKDITEDEYVDKFRDDTRKLLTNGFSRLQTEEGLRATHQYFSRSFEDVVRDHRNEALSGITDPGESIVAAGAVDKFITCLMYEFAGPICNQRFAISEYAYRMEDGELIEETRPISIDPSEFWKNVNN